MNCHAFAAVLDERRLPELPDEERHALLAHAAACLDCGAALAATRALAGDRVPTVQHALSWTRIAAAAARRESPAPETRPVDRAGAAPARRRARRAVVLGAILGAGGVAFAAYYGDVWERLSSRDLGPSGGRIATGQSLLEASRPQAGGGDYYLSDYVRDAELRSQSQFAAKLFSEPLLPDGDMFPLLKVTPIYPPEAATAGLAGSAVVEFTVTAEGDAADVVVIETTDPLFGPPSVDAARRFRYKPRVVEGRPVAVTGIRNRITYVLDGEPSTADETREDEPASGRSEPELSWLDYKALLAPAHACLDADDFRCVELALDELGARPDLSARQQADLANIYGFIHHRRGDRQRALEAYRRAAELHQPEQGNVLPLMIVAQIHYEQHQYQAALDAAIVLQRSQSPSPGDHVLVDRLRQLGAQLR